MQTTVGEGALVAFGASITDGLYSTTDVNHRWTNYLTTRLLAAHRQVGVLNAGISGNRLLVDGAGQSALHRLGRDVLQQPGVKWMIFSDDPINDVGDTRPEPGADDLITAYGTMLDQAHAAGIKVLCSTLPPFEGAAYWTSQGEATREAVNVFLRGGSSGCDALVDQDTALHDPAQPTKYLPIYDSGDHLHPNDAGMQAIAQSVDLSLLR